MLDSRRGPIRGASRMNRCQTIIVVTLLYLCTVSTVSVFGTNRGTFYAVVVAVENYSGTLAPYALGAAAQEMRQALREYARAAGYSAERIEVRELVDNSAHLLKPGPTEVVTAL